VQITDGDLRLTSAGGKLATGVDLAFLDADGATPLPFELDHPIGAAGDLLAWVKLPVLSASAETRFYLAFGDASVTASTEAPAALWSNGYVGAWHFSEPGYAGVSGESVDATGVHHGTGSGAVTTTAMGQLGRALSVGTNTSCITIPESPDLRPPSVTVSAWARAQDIGAPGDHIATIVAQDQWRAPGTGSQGYYLEIYRSTSDPRPTFYAANGPTIAHAFSANTVANNAWVYAVGTYDAASGTSRIYVNGVLRGSATMTGPIAYLANPVLFGLSSSPGWWIGDIDEVRIASVVRPPAWIATEHANQADPGSFATFGPTEATPR
jgi:hypothetical protein